MAKRKSFSADYEAADVLELYQIRSTEKDEARIRRLAGEFRELCRIERAVEIPSQYKAITKEVRTPFVRDARDRITASLVAKPPVNHITPKDDKRSDYREAANIGERWDTALIERINKERGSDIDYNLAAQLVRDGESVLKVVHKPDAWANFPEDVAVDEQDQYKKGVDLPITWCDVDRLQVVRERGEYGDEWVLEYGEYTKPYLRNRYSMVESDDKKLIDPKRCLEGRPLPEGLASSATGRSVKVEFFTSKEWHVIIDGSEAPGYPKKNPYAPYLPYFFAPAYDGESLLYSLLFLVPRLDELLTMKVNWSFLGAYPNPVIESVPNQGGLPSLDMPYGNPGDVVGGAAGQQRLTWSPGKAMELPVGKTLKFLVPPPVGKDLNDMTVLLKSLIDIAGIPSIMRGSAASGDSGYLANQLRAAAEMDYKIATISLARQREKALEFTHWIVSNIVQQTVYVQGWSAINPKTGKPKERASQSWLGLSPEGSGKNIAPINKLGPVSCQYRPTLPTDEQARAMIALQLTNAEKPLYSRRKALETWMQEEDAESILDDIAVEEAMNEEPLKSLWLGEALEEAGIRQPGAPNPAAALVDQFGQPLVPPGPGQLQPVPLANQMVSGTPAVPGLTIPIQPGPPAPPGGIPGNPGGRRAGMYPGLPSNQGTR